MRWLFLVLAFAACSKKDPEPKREDRHDPVEAPARLSVDIVIDDARSTWHDDAFTATPKLAGTASDGEARDTWSLRELVHHNVGPMARVTAVVSATGTKPIDQAAWDDAAQTPILHTTRRGTLKFRWADKAGRWGETILKDVTRLEIAR